MAIPNISISVQNGGLGVSADKSDGIQAIVGRISSGEFVDKSGSAIPSDSQLAVNTPTQFGTQDALIAACGTGVVAQAASLILETGHPVIVCRAADTDSTTSTSDWQVCCLAAVDALKTSSLTFELVHLVCDANTIAPTPGTISYPTQPVSASSLDSLISALDLKGTAFFGAHHYDGALFVVELEEVDSSQSITISNPSNYVAVCRGFVKSVNPISGATQYNPLAWHACQRCSQVGLGRDLAATADGPLSGVSALVHDETTDAGACDSLGITTVRTFPRHAGVYLTNARICSSSTSDFKYWQHRRVMNAACAAAYDYLFRLLSENVQVDTETGHIVESAARAIEANTESAIRDRVGEWVSGLSASVDRSANILSTSTIPVSISIIPLGYIKTITVKIGFENPALAQT